MQHFELINKFFAHRREYISGGDCAVCLYTDKQLWHVWVADCIISQQRVRSEISDRRHIPLYPAMRTLGCILRWSERRLPRVWSSFFSRKSDVFDIPALTRLITYNDVNLDWGFKAYQNKPALRFSSRLLPKGRARNCTIVSGLLTVWYVTMWRIRKWHVTGHPERWGALHYIRHRGTWYQSPCEICNIVP